MFMGSNCLTSLVNNINMAKEKLKYQQGIIFRNKIWKKVSPKQTLVIHSSTFKSFKMRSLVDTNNRITDQTHSAMVQRYFRVFPVYKEQHSRLLAFLILFVPNIVLSANSDAEAHVYQECTFMSEDAHCDLTRKENV